MCVVKKLTVFLLLFSVLANAQDYKEIPRRVPPKGIQLKVDQRKQIDVQLSKLRDALKGIEHPLLADVTVYEKAINYALLHGEFYRKDDWKKALNLAKIGIERAQKLKENKVDWTKKKGTFARGFISEIDGSVQPYGLEIPKDVDLSKPVSLWVWLHGRGEKETDLHFMNKFSYGKYKFPDHNVIVLHPLGRQCIGWKSTGQFDALEAIEHVKKNYNIDENRVVMMGFSMGGAGAWQLGAQFTDKWAFLHAGAGFVETKNFMRMKPEDYPAWYVQKLWGVYDIPHYVRNLFNIPVIAYSGEKDRQIQAAQEMEKAYKAHGKELTHLIGPDMGHKYAKGYLEDIAKRIAKSLEKGRNTHPEKVSLQTRTLRYAKMYWVKAEGLNEHWLDSRIDAQRNSSSIKIETKNISAFSLTSPWKDKNEIPSGTVITIDGQKVTVSNANSKVLLVKDGTWKVSSGFTRLRKKPALQGPVDDALNDPFMVVIPSGKSKNEKINKWVDFSIKHLINRWRAVFRGELRIKKDSEVTDEDIKKYHLIAWGDADSNSLIKKTIGKLPLKWDSSEIQMNGKSYKSSHHVPVMTYPNPLNNNKYLVINTGPTFREHHDGNNSLQNPHIPDWAVIDVNTPPDKYWAGKIVTADFFDEFWNWKTKNK